MSTGTKTLLGILSFLSVVLLGVWIYFYIRWIMEFIPHASAYGDDPVFVEQSIMSLIGTSVALMIPGGLISLFLLIFYIIQVVNNQTMETGERVVWIITLIIFCPLTFPIYWLMRVQNLPPKGLATHASPTIPPGPSYG